MAIIIYSSEADMPKHLQSQKQSEWNILDRMDWDTYNFVPTDYPQKSLFHNHNTWNSHRTDYFNLMNIQIAEKEAAETRIKIDNKIGTAASFAEELKQAEEEEKEWEEEEAKEKAEAEEFEALQVQLAADEYKNTILPTPEPYMGFVKLTDAEKRERRRKRDKRDYQKNKEKIKAKVKDKSKDVTYMFCEFCGGEHKDTPQGRSNHNVSQIHTTKVLRVNICNHYIKQYPNVKTMERAERVLDNKIKESEDSLCIKYTPTTLKNKYRRLWAQYAS